jgi:hypothetical protein
MNMVWFIAIFKLNWKKNKSVFFYHILRSCKV